MRFSPYFYALLLGSGLVLSCSGSDFAGSSAKPASATKKKDSKSDSPGDDDDATTEPPNRTETEKTTDDPVKDDGEKSKPAEPETTDGCATGGKIQDAGATFSFNNENEIRTFVNGLGKYTHISPEFIGAGGVRADQPSADAVCNAKGYQKSTGKQQASYHSCHDNFVFPWDASQKNFVQHNACDFNQRLSQLTCTGKLKDICANNPGWVFGKTETATGTSTGTAP